MTIATWSWIFFLQIILLVQPGFAQLDQNLHRHIARKVLGGVFVRSLSPEATTKHIFIGVAVAASVFLLAGVASLVIIVRKSHAEFENKDPEAVQIPPVEKPNWWMVDSDSKADWWRLSLQPPAPAALAVQADTQGGRTDRLKNALQLNRSKNVLARKPAISPAETITLPMQTVPAPEPAAPKQLQTQDKAYPAASYPAFTLTPPQSDEDSRPKIPAPIVINPALLRTQGNSERRTGAPRSPAHKRRSKASRNQLRNPFLPPRTPIISKPLPVNAAQLADPKLAHPLGKPRSALRVTPSGARPPVLPKIRPAPLDLNFAQSVKTVTFGERF